MNKTQCGAGLTEPGLSAKKENTGRRRIPGTTNTEATVLYGQIDDAELEVIHTLHVLDV